MFNETRNFKSQLLQGIANRLMKLNNLNNQMKDLFGVDAIDMNKFSNIKWQPTEIPDEIVNIEEDVSSHIIHDVCVSNENEEAVKSLKYKFAFREEKLKEIMDGVLEMR
jgi:hypothetical protein